MDRSWYHHHFAHRLYRDLCLDGAVGHQESQIAYPIVKRSPSGRSHNDFVIMQLVNDRIIVIGYCYSMVMRDRVRMEIIQTPP